MADAPYDEQPAVAPDQSSSASSARSVSASWDTELTDRLRLRADSPGDGFVAVVSSPGLAAVQARCLDPDATGQVLTARYKISGTPVVETMLVAFATDLFALREGTASQLGDLRTTRPDGWVGLLDGLGIPETTDESSSVAGMEWLRAITLSQELTWGAVGRFCGNLGGALLTGGGRLVLMVSAGDDIDLAREIAVLEVLAGSVPAGMAVIVGVTADERVLSRLGSATGPNLVVLSGVPPDPDGGSPLFRQDPQTDLASDKPTAVDLLGRLRLADTLANLLVHPDTGELCVGVEAPWGKGKSSFLNLVEEQLRQIAGPQVLVIRFNAWQYESASEAWAGLAEHAIGTIEASLSLAQRWWMRLRYAWRFRRRELLVGGVATVLAIVVGVWLFRAGRGASVSGVDLVSPAARVLATATGLSTTLAALVVAVFRITRPVAQRVSDYFSGTSYGDRLGFQHQVIRDLTFARDSLVRVRPGCRIVVMVDDLDRCSDEKTVELLQAINLVLSESGLYVLIGLDGTVVRRAVHRHYSGDEEHLPDVHRLPVDFADQFMRKIVQISLHLPDSSEQERLRFVDALLHPPPEEAPPEESGPAASGALLPAQTSRIQPATSGTATLVRDTADDVTALRAYQHVLEDNPRAIKRLLNVHRFVKIALLSEGGEEPPPLQQRLLVQWLVFCAARPDLVVAALDRADSHTDRSADVLAELPGLETWIPELRRLLPDEVITPADLAPGARLRQAAGLAVHLPD